MYIMPWFDEISRHSSIPVVCLCYCNSADYEHSDIHNELNYCISFTGATRTVMYVCCRDGRKKDHSGPSKTGKK